MSDKRICRLCGEDLEDPPAIHDKALCEKTELLKGRIEIQRLRESLSYWKDSWFQLREIIGHLWWHHPAIDNDVEREYYKKQSNVS